MSLSYRVELSSLNSSPDTGRRITLTEDILGTLPGNPEIYRDYIATKADSSEKFAEETELMEEAAENNDFSKNITIFARNKDNEPCVFDYLIKGFFKNACNAMRDSDDSESKKLTSYKKKIDNLVFVYPRMIKINFEGEITYCERPLRASTPQGERVALSCSESIAAGATLEFTVRVLKDDMLKYVIEWLDYGQYNGLGQWHNSGKGRFTWRDITNEK